MLTKEEFLKPRYKVIGDWPARFFFMGSILTVTLEQNGELSITIDCEEVRREYYTWNVETQGGHLDDFPHLFEKLPWYKHRRAHEMPRYVKWAQSTPVQVAEVVQWDMEGGMFPMCLIKGECAMRCVVECDLMPAAEKEYLTYKNKNHG